MDRKLKQTKPLSAPKRTLFRSHGRLARPDSLISPATEILLIGSATGSIGQPWTRSSCRFTDSPNEPITDCKLKQTKPLPAPKRTRYRSHGRLARPDSLTSPATEIQLIGAETASTAPDQIILPIYEFTERTHYGLQAQANETASRTKTNPDSKPPLAGATGLAHFPGHKNPIDWSGNGVHGPPRTRSSCRFTNSPNELIMDRKPSKPNHFPHQNEPGFKGHRRLARPDSLPSPATEILWIGSSNGVRQPTPDQIILPIYEFTEPIIYRNPV